MMCAVNTDFYIPFGLEAVQLCSLQYVVIRWLRPQCCVHPAFSCEGFAFDKG